MGWFGPKTGISNAPAIASMFEHDRAFVLFDDFFNYDATATVGNYITSQHSGGGTAVASDAHGGILTLDAGGTSDEDGPCVQCVHECVLPAAGKKIYFECRFKVTSAVASCALAIGLADLDTTVFTTNNARNLSDYMIFYWDPTSIAASGAGYLQFAVGDASGEDGSSATTAMLVVAGTWHTVGFEFDYDANTVRLFFDGAFKEQMSLTRANIPATELTPTFAITNEGTAATSNMVIDYWKLIATR